MVTRLYKFNKEIHVSQIGLAAIILVMPFTLFLHLFFSEDVNILSFFIFEIDHSFNNNRGWAWNFLSIIIPLMLMLIWFITCFEWWRYIILLPVSLYITRIVVKIFRYPNLVESNLTLFSIIIALALVSIIVIFDKHVFVKFREQFFLMVRLKLFNRKMRRFYYWLNSKMIITDSLTSDEDKYRYMNNLFYTKSVVESEIDKFSKLNSINFVRRKNWDYTIVFLLFISCAFFLHIRYCHVI